MNLIERCHCVLNLKGILDLRSKKMALKYILIIVPKLYCRKKKRLNKKIFQEMGCLMSAPHEYYFIKRPCHLIVSIAVVKCFADNNTSSKAISTL